VKKIVAARVNFPPGRHARHTSHEGAGKSYGPFPEPFKIGGMDPGVPVIGKKMPVQRIEHDHYYFHGTII